MFKGNITAATAAAADTNIPFGVVWNTNRNTAYNAANDTIVIREAGYYNVNVSLVVTGSTPTTVTAQLFANGDAVADGIASADITATTGIQTLNITDTIRVVPANNNAYLELAVQLADAATINAGNITVEKVR